MRPSKLSNNHQEKIILSNELNDNLAVNVNDLTKTENFQQTNQKLTEAWFVGC